MSLIYENINIQEHVARYYERMHKSYNDKKDEYPYPRLSSFSEEARNSPFFLDRYFKVPVLPIDYSYIGKDVLKNKEFITEIIMGGKNLDILFLVDENLIDDVALNYMNTYGKKQDINLYKYLSIKKSVYEENVSQQENLASILKYNLDNLLYINPKDISDATLKGVIYDLYETSKRNNGDLKFQTHLLFKARDYQWWENDQNIKDFIQLSKIATSSPLSIPINNFSEDFALSLVINQPKLIKKYFQKYGFNEDNVEKIITQTLLNHVNPFSGGDKKQLLKEIESCSDWQSKEVTNIYSGIKKMSTTLTQEILTPIYSEIAKYCEKNNVNTKLINFNKDEKNIIKLLMVLSNGKISQSDFEEAMKHLNDHFELKEENKHTYEHFVAELLKIPLRERTVYRHEIIADQKVGRDFLFKSHVAKMWNVEEIDIINMRRDDFINRFIKEQEKIKMLSMTSQATIVKKQVLKF
jgi:hypothetical protein